MEFNDATYRGMGPVRVQVINKCLGIYSLIHFFFSLYNKPSKFDSPHGDHENAQTL